VAGAPGGRALKKILVRVAQALATVVVTWFVVTRAGLTLDELGSVGVAEWPLRWPLLVASAAVLFAGYCINGFLWGRIVEGLGGARLSPWVSVRIFTVANLGRYVPGKVWQIASLSALAKPQGIPGPTAAAAAVIGQGVALAAATLVGLGAVWTLEGANEWRWLAPAVLVGGAVFGLLPPVFHRVFAVWFRIAKTPEPDGLGPTNAIGWLLVSLLNWTIYGIAFWMLVEGLGLDMALLPAASAFAAAYVLGYVMVFAPAGIGVREGFLIALLSPQVGAAAAGAVAVIARLWTTLIEVLPAAAFWARHLSTTAPSAPNPRD
jgi:glycosyltransferase 2 family protein